MKASPRKLAVLAGQWTLFRKTSAGGISTLTPPHILQPFCMKQTVIFILRSVNGSPCNHKLHYNLMLQPGVCGASDVKLFDNEVKGRCSTETELSHFGQHGPISVLMFYSPCCWLLSHFPPFKCHSVQPIYLQFHSAKCSHCNSERQQSDHQSWIDTDSFLSGISFCTDGVDVQHYSQLVILVQILWSLFVGETPEDFTCIKHSGGLMIKLLRNEFFWQKGVFSLTTTNFIAGLVSVCAAHIWVPTYCHPAAPSSSPLLPNPQWS